MSALTTQELALVPTEGQGKTVSSQVVALAVYNPPSTDKVLSSQLLVNVPLVEQGISASSQLLALVCYRTGSIENLRNRAWSFSLDGHTFYVITLGEQGTFVYDEYSGGWSQWQTQGLPGWNMEIGIEWKNNIIAADQGNPIIWKLNPSSFLDDGYKTQIRKSSGGLPVRNRDFPSNTAFRIEASMGRPAVGSTLPVTDPTVSLRISDDQGNTWFEAGEVTVVAGVFKQQLQWLSLGVMQAPGRVFELTDTGAIARIDGADAEVDGE